MKVSFDRTPPFDWVAFVFIFGAIFFGLLLVSLAAVGCDAAAECERRGGVYVRKYGSGHVCLDVKEFSR